MFVTFWWCVGRVLGWVLGGCGMDFAWGWCWCFAKNDYICKLAFVEAGLFRKVFTRSDDWAGT